MKRFIFLILSLIWQFSLWAQDPDARYNHVLDEQDDQMAAVENDSVVRPKLTHELLEEARRDTAASHIIDLPISNSPMAHADMMAPYGFYSPWSYGYPGAWSLHEGLNAEVGFSVSGSFGKNRIKGAGFGEHFAAAYAMPIGKNKRAIGAIGLYADRLDWGTYNRTEVGIAGVLGYHVNDWCNLYVYGTYNFMPGQSSAGPNPFYAGYGYYGGGMWDPYANLRARIGAAAEFKLGEHAALRLSFEHDFYDNDQLPALPKNQNVKPQNYGGDGPGGAPSGGNGRSF